MMNPDFILPDKTRYGKLKSWLHSRGLTIEKIAKAAGLPKETAYCSLRNERAEQARIDQFLALGIPKSLLPKPWRVKTKKY